MDTIKRNDTSPGIPGRVIAPESRGHPSTLNRRDGEYVSPLPLPRFPCKCVFLDLPLSYCTYDEGSKFSGAISPERRETIPRKDPRRRVRRPERRKECSLEDQRFPETRPKGDYVCANTRGILRREDPGSSPSYSSSPVRPVLSPLQRIECPRRSSFVDRGSRFSLEYLTFVSARTDRLCPGVTTHCPELM